MNADYIAFIGGGNMATSLISGLIANDYPKELIQVADPEPQRCNELQLMGIKHIYKSNLEAINNARTVVLCVKPQIAELVCREIALPIGQKRPLIISIMAGVSTRAMQNWFGIKLPMIRTMPNTPVMVKTGAIGLYASPEVDVFNRDYAETVFSAVGFTRWVQDETQIDAITAISGSGPAYFLLFMEALENAGIALGLDNKTARLLTIQTALGAAKMAFESNDSPSLLREQVTSPGGTTERALTIFKTADLHTIVLNAATAARERAIEISQALNPSE